MINAGEAVIPLRIELSPPDVIAQQGLAASATGRAEIHTVVPDTVTIDPVPGHAAYDLTEH